jgi:predicted transcriptional regulator
MSQRIEELAQKLRASGDHNRLKILCLLLKDQKFCVSDIAQKLNLDIAVVSYHLQTLLREKIVQTTRDGKKICYKIRPSKFNNDLKNLICKYK